MAELSAREVRMLVNDLDRLITRAGESASVTFATSEATAVLAALQLKLPAEVGGADQNRKWAEVPEQERKEFLAHLRALREGLDDIVEPSSIMSGRLAPTWAIALLLALAMGTIGGTFYGIRELWPDAMPDEMNSPERQAAYTALKQHAEQLTRQRTVIQAQIDTQSADVTRLENERQNAAQTSPPDPAALEKLGLQLAAARAREAETRKELDAAVQREVALWLQASQANIQPRGLDVLLMVILFGALGGCLHLASSLTMYIGNRDFKRSWIPYYLLAPFQGAALAPLIFLLMKSAILSPQEAGNTAALNLTAIYAFSGLTGLFAKQAIERLATVFAALFAKVEAKDKTKSADAAGT